MTTPIPAVLTTVIAVGLGVVTLALLSGCALSSPLRRVETGPVTGPVVVAVTYARYDRAQSATFWSSVEQALSRIDAQSGLVGYRVRRTLLGQEAWTMTFWRNDAALEAYLAAAEHRRAVRDGKPTLTAMRSTRFTIPAEDWPVTWDQALARLDADDPARP